MRGSGRHWLRERPGWSAGTGSEWTVDGYTAYTRPNYKQTAHSVDVG